MSILILIDGQAVDLVAGAARLVGAARQLGDDITLFIAGVATQEQAAPLAVLEGIREVIWCGLPATGEGGVPVEDLAHGVVSMAGEYTHILAAASTFGAERIPRIASQLGVAPVTGVVEIRAADTFVRPIHAGALLSLVRLHASPVLLTVQPWAFAPVATGDSAVTVGREVVLPRLGLSVWGGRMAVSRQGGNGDLDTARVV
ncbi:MAG: hypothetical protein G8237_15555, partial [Magnetococcales bacterium]|nr:hypothetical protein [Magnetococcales bacterium]